MQILYKLFSLFFYCVLLRFRPSRQTHHTTTTTNKHTHTRGVDAKRQTGLLLYRVVPVHVRRGIYEDNYRNAESPRRLPPPLPPTASRPDAVSRAVTPIIAVHETLFSRFDFYFFLFFVRQAGSPLHDEPSCAALIAPTSSGLRRKHFNKTRRGGVRKPQPAAAALVCCCAVPGRAEGPPARAHCSTAPPQRRAIAHARMRPHRSGQGSRFDATIAQGRGERDN